MPISPNNDKVSIQLVGVAEVLLEHILAKWVDGF
jgi:hypothetical protein